MRRRMPGWIFFTSLVLVCVNPFAARALPVQERLAAPYYMQGARNWCGPASLAMALKYVGVDAEIWEIASAQGKVSEPCNGALDLLTCYQSGATFAQDHAKFVAARYAVREHLHTETRTYWLLRSETRLKDQIKAYIAQGYPVMLMSVARVHWILITGYSAKGVWYHDPSGAFNPGCGRGPGCLIDAYLPWDVFMKTLRGMGAAQLQLFVVKKNEWKTVPAKDRKRPRPTIQILPEFWRPSRDRTGYGPCKDCFVESADGRDSLAFSFLQNSDELARFRRLGMMLRPVSGTRPVQKPWGAAVRSGDRIHTVFATFNMASDERYAVSVKAVDTRGKWTRGFSSDTDKKKFTGKPFGTGPGRMWTSDLVVNGIPGDAEIIRFVIALWERKTGQIVDQIDLPLKIQR